MPKKSRQAHVPSQIRKRKTRRPGQMPAAPEPAPLPEPVFADPPIGELSSFGAAGPVEVRPRRRLELLTQSREQATIRVVPGQLPTFERAFLVSELRRITLTAGSLLALIVLLSIILR